MMANISVLMSGIDTTPVRRASPLMGGKSVDASWPMEDFPLNYDVSGDASWALEEKPVKAVNWHEAMPFHSLGNGHANGN